MSPNCIDKLVKCIERFNKDEIDADTSYKISKQILVDEFDDPDAPMGTWVHWVLYGLSPDTLELPEDVPDKKEVLGGPLFLPENGKVIGMLNSAFIKVTKENKQISTGISYAIPINYIKKLIESINDK
ncbi:MAG: hypothetical protein V3V72_05805 [Ignavibacteriaceae bacterium]